jgi:thioredoxin reductase (NADPH)
MGSEITVFGAHWCPDCQRTKKFLGEQRIAYEWVDIEAHPEGERQVLEKNGGKRIIPTIVFPDGSILVEPSNAELARKLGLRTEARQAFYDVIIIGGGPTGLTAAIYSAREGLDTLLIERSALGGQAAITVGIENFPGFPEGITGLEFSNRVVQQARRFGVEILQAQEATQVTQHDGYPCVVVGDGRHYHANAILLATGATYRRLEVPGEEDYLGAGIHFCATCDGPFYKGAREIVVVGGGNSACEEGLHLTKFAQQVTLVVRGDKLSASQILIDKINEPNSKIKVLYNQVVEQFCGIDGKLRTMTLKHRQTGDISELQPAAAFIFIGLQPNSALAKNVTAVDPFGYLLTGYDLVRSGVCPETSIPQAFQTSVPGIFAAGDVRHGSTKQVASAVGEGAAAAIAIREYLKQH